MTMENGRRIRACTMQMPHSGWTEEEYAETLADMKELWAPRGRATITGVDANALLPIGGNEKAGGGVERRGEPRGRRFGKWMREAALRKVGEGKAAWRDREIGYVLIEGKRGEQEARGVDIEVCHRSDPMPMAVDITFESRGRRRRSGWRARQKPEGITYHRGAGYQKKTR